MANYTKQNQKFISSEIVYFKDGVEIAREEQFDTYFYDSDSPEPMTDDEISDYGDEED